MAHLRASSEPNGNPFWSERARGEFQLQISRPRDLDVMSSGPTRDLLPPVPPEREGEWSEGSVSRDPLQDESREGRGRTRSRHADGAVEGRNTGETKRSFRTPPSSWNVSDRGLISQKKTVNEAVGPKTQGPMPMDSSETGEKQQSLEEALGEELVQKLLRENQELKESLRKQQESQKSASSGSWMEVSPQEPAPQTPRAQQQGNRGVRFTPGGTQVPFGTPPTDAE